MNVFEACVITFLATLSLLAFYFRSKKRKIVVFFHPYDLNDDVPHEILIDSIQTLQNKVTNVGIYSPYSTITQTNINALKLSNNYPKFHFFPIKIPVVPSKRNLLSLKLPAQLFYSFVAAFRCLLSCVPSIIIDTTGVPFCAPVWKLFGGCKVIIYSHHFAISPKQLMDLKPSFINDDIDSHHSSHTEKSTRPHRFKYWLLSITGPFIDHSIAPSISSGQYIHSISGLSPTILYPPCNLEQLLTIPLSHREAGLILCLCTFSAEDRLPMQISMMKDIAIQSSNAHLVIASRNAGDPIFIDELQTQIRSAGLQNRITIQPSATAPELHQLLSKAQVGLHTVYNDPFSHTVVAYISAGVIPVANKSGSPLYDIVRDEAYLALEKDEYVTKVLDALTDSADVRVRFRNDAYQFTKAAFQEGFWDNVSGLIDDCTI